MLIINRPAFSSIEVFKNLPFRKTTRLSVHKSIFPFVYKIQPFVIKIKARAPLLREGLYTISPFKFLRL
jgi:hypothetical protein